MNRPWHIYIVCSCEEICNTSLFCCSRIPLRHQFPQYYPMFSSGGILSSHQILNFAFPHIWSFTDQALFPCDYIYIRPWNPLSLFYQDLVCSDSDLSFLQQSLPCGLQVVMVGTATIYGGDRWRQMYALFDFPSSQHLVLIFPTLDAAILSIIYHLLIQFIWWGCVR